MRQLTIIALTILTSISVWGQSSNENSYVERDGLIITMADGLILKKPVDFDFLKANIYGRLFLTNPDFKTIDYSFTIQDIKKERKNKEYMLTVYVKSEPKTGGIGHLGKSFYRITLKKKNKTFTLDKVDYEGTEI
jgi:hypothetical protein